MFGLGAPELLLVLLILLLFFGGTKLPQLFNSLGRSMKEFREASEANDEPTTTTTTTSNQTTTGAIPSTTVAQTPTETSPPRETTNVNQ